MEKVFIVPPDHYGVAAMWMQAQYQVVDSPDEARIICFTGGADINPAIYGAEKHPRTYYSSQRDEAEIPFFKNYEAPTKLKVGICRGAQLLCALNGGTLYQDVDRHAGGIHPVMYKDERGNMVPSRVSSAHHQMMNPHRMSTYEEWATAALSSYRDLDKSDRREPSYEEGNDPEILYYPLTASYCFQGHPEFGDDECVRLFHLSVKRALKAQKARAEYERQYLEVYSTLPGPRIFDRANYIVAPKPRQAWRDWQPEEDDVEINEAFGGPDQEEED